MFTIRDCLNFDFIPWKKNLLNIEGDLDRVIDYVSVNDLPLDDFIRKNEAVIAIATPYVNQPALMYEFVKGLVEAEASVFLLSIPSDDMKLDERSRKYAEMHGLSVYLIPWNVRFADIIENVLDNIHYLYEKDLESFKEIQSKLLESFLKNEDINTALDIIAKELSCQIALTYSNGDLVGKRNISSDMKNFSLDADKKPYGYLYYTKELTDKSTTMLKNTLSPLLSLWFYRDELIETTHRIAKDDFIWSLADGANPEDPEVARTAEHMNLKLKRQYSCIVCRLDMAEIYSEEAKTYWIESNIAAIESEITQLAEKSHYTIMITHRGNQLIIYFENLSEHTKQLIDRFLANIESVIGKKNASLTFAWGISEIKEGKTDFKNYYIHANLASELCSYEPQRTNRFFYESSLVHNIMSDLFADDEFFDDTLDILNPLIEYGKAKNNGIIDTLKVYLATRSVAETSRILEKHRQTVLYQINKIEEITKMSLKEPDDLYLLETCIRLHFGMTYTS